MGKDDRKGLIKTLFRMSKDYKHVSVLYHDNKPVAIIQAKPPNHIETACSVHPESVIASKSMDWMQAVIGTIKKDNGQ